jgi:hypothetical protein
MRSAGRWERRAKVAESPLDAWDQRGSAIPLTLLLGTTFIVLP